MPRFFNTAGPNDPADHFTLPARTRLPTLRRLIDQKRYIVFRAPREAGKTTALLALARELTAEGHHLALLLPLEQGHPFPHDPGTAELAILASWRRTAAAWLPPDLQPPPWPDAPPGERLAAALSAWAEASSRPLVLFLDELDALHDSTRLSILRQIRAGYPTRPAHFPHALVLVGLRDVREVGAPQLPAPSEAPASTRTPQAHGSAGLLQPGNAGYYPAASAAFHPSTSAVAPSPGATNGHALGSPLHLETESISLRNFTRAEVAELFGQHTAETGQVFLPDATDRAFFLTQGQPWLVNALARLITEDLVPDPAEPITTAHVDEAKEQLLRRRDPHLDHRMAHLHEPRVRAILEPMLAGGMLGTVSEDDVRYALDLGLTRMDPAGGLEVTSPIDREALVRALTYTRRASLPHLPATWRTAEGRLDKEALLRALLDFWRHHGEPLRAAAPYPEVAPHLVLMAFLHRVVEGRSIEREYALGRGRMDLCVRDGGETVAITIKVWRPEQKADPLPEGLHQLDAYLAGLGLDTGWLVLFDRRPSAPPLAERLGAAPITSPGGRRITLIRA
ncbi:ATP-binding protein [Chondromyces crocatus]|uniref:ATPase AAA n=1 Tax=Chondromyces crocatus TaxID=52 RepID=A0A0K1EHN4_CHOCO|nr:ATP-binding protein [Chondromyces crocatus]AKT40391.1 ATPase AAA [Chondromyces crocatus]